MAADGWCEVRHRRRSPTNPTTSITPPKDLIHPYIPFYSQKTFAQVVTTGLATSLPTSGGSLSSKTPSPLNSRPNSPPNAIQSQSYESPHSPTTLRFLPQPAHAEWRNRCFHCLRVGHTAAKCCNKLRCGRCWHEGHVVAKCSAPNLNPLAKPFTPTAGSSAAAQPMKATTVVNDWPKLPGLGKTHPEPSFDNLLYLEKSQGCRLLPEERPEKIQVFLDRDAAYYSKIRKLSKAVIIDRGNHTPALQPEEATQLAVATGLVREEEIRVALLARGRTLIHLPRGLKVDTFIRALPATLWDKGYNI